MKRFYIIPLFFSCVFTIAQSSEKSNDFSKIDQVITSLYGVISGPAGERDWELFKSLFHENGSMGAIRLNAEGKRDFLYFDPEGYIDRNGGFFKQNGFYEEEIGREVKVFGGVAQVFTAYQFRINDQKEIAQRGINCIQLVFENNRWYITNIVWDTESDTNKIPESLLKH